MACPAASAALVLGVTELFLCRGLPVKAALGCCRTGITRLSVRVVLVAKGARISLALDQVQHHTFRARPSQMLPSSPSHPLGAARIVGYQKSWVADIPPLATLSPTIRLSSSAKSRVSSIS